MSTDITLFDFEGNDVRIIDQNGDSWFVLKDILTSMGSSTPSNVAKASIINGLGDGYNDVTPIVDSIGRTQNITIVNEAAVTFLVSRSNTDTGKRLNRWIHGEVLPSIRKTGSYSMQQQLPDFTKPAEAARAWADMYEEREKVSLIAQEQQQKIEEDTPKVEFWNDVGDSHGLLSMGDAVKSLNIIGLGRNKAMAMMRALDILQSTTTNWNVPYQRFINQGYFAVKQKTNYNGSIAPVTLVTHPKGSSGSILNFGNLS